jgi:hypothetical protein
MEMDKMDKKLYFWDEHPYWVSKAGYEGFDP